MEFHDVQKKPSRYPVSVRLRISTEDYELIRVRATAFGETVSAYLRRRAIGGKTPSHIQDLRDIAQLRQHFGLLKKIMTNNPYAKDLEPLLNSITDLISAMREKANL